MNNHGIQSSVFYGEQAYFIPCHQHLSTDDLDYFIAVIKSFINNMKFSNIQLGENVEIDPSTSFNNVVISHDVRIAKRCSIFGVPKIYWK